MDKRISQWRTMMPPHVSVHSPKCNPNVCSSSCAHICSSLFLFFKWMICMRLSACMCSWCMNAGAAGPYGARGWQSVPASPRKTTESEKQVYLRGGSQRAFPRSLIRDSDSAEEVRGRRRLGRWRRRRRARTGCTGIWQGGNSREKMDLWGPLNDQHPSLYSERFLGLLGQMGGEGKSTLVGLCHLYYLYLYSYLYLDFSLYIPALISFFTCLVNPAAVLTERHLRDVPFCPRSPRDLRQLTSDTSGAPEREREQEIKCEAFRAWAL